MRQLRLVGLAEDGTSVVLAAPTGDEYRLAVDERLRAACRGDLTRLGQIEIEMGSPLRPAEIQSRVRAGESAEEVAASSGMPLDRVLRFAYPMLHERERVAAQARAATLRPKDPTTLGELVEGRLIARGTDATTLRWDARRRDDGQWTVRLSWRHAAEHSASWTFQLSGRRLRPDDPAAEQLSAEEFHARTITAVTPLAAATPMASPRTEERSAASAGPSGRGTARPSAGPSGRGTAGSSAGPSGTPARGTAGSSAGPSGTPAPGTAGPPGAPGRGTARRSAGSPPPADPASPGGARPAADGSLPTPVPSRRPDPDPTASDPAGPGGARPAADGSLPTGPGPVPTRPSGTSSAASGPTGPVRGGPATGRRAAGGSMTTSRQPGPDTSAPTRAAATDSGSAPSGARPRASDRGGRGGGRRGGDSAGDGGADEAEPVRRVAAGGGEPMLETPEEERARRASVPSWDDILLGVRRRH